MDPVWRRSRAVGRAQRPIQHQAAARCSTGCQMGGWFTREIKSPEEYKGLRYRMAGPGAEVLRRFGAIGGDLAGRRDYAGAQVGRPRRQRMDRPLARYGVRPAQGGRLLLLSRRSTSPDPVSRSASTRACGRASMPANGGSSRRRPRASTRALLAEFNANNALWLRKLREEGVVKILKFDDSLLNAFLKISKGVVAETGPHDELSRRFTRATSGSARRSWIGATSPNAPT